MSSGSQAIIEFAEEPIPDLANLREVAPPAALVARVMTRVSDPVTPTLWQWFSRPVRVELRVSPLGVIGLAALLAVGLALFVAR